MRVLSLHLIATLSALTIVGCMAEATSSNPPSGDVAMTDHAHQMPFRDRDSHNGTLQPGLSTATMTLAGPHLNYYGGKIILGVAITKVLYGSGTYIPELTSTTGVNMESSYTQMVTSGVFNWLDEYNTSSPAQSMGGGSYQGSVQITPAPARNGSTILDADIQAEINAQINAHTLPVPTDNVIYMVNFPSGKTILAGGLSSCGSFCGYHHSFKIGTQNVYYSVLPDMTGGCAAGCGSGTPFQIQQSIASHELIEAITDPEADFSSPIGLPLAWFDPTNHEIGDICNHQQDAFVGTDGNTYTIQQEFSNQANSCITTRTGSTSAIYSPAPDSTLTGPVVTFSWTTGSGVSQHLLTVGNSVGASDIYAASQGVAMSGAVSGLPTDGRTLYVRLWSFISSGWQSRDYTYTAAAIFPANINSPAPGSTLANSSVTFFWTTGSGVSQYFLYVGNSVGGNDIYGASQGLATSSIVSGLPTDGRMLYVRLWSFISSGWQYRDYTYIAVNLSTPAVIYSPTPGSMFPGSTVTFSWTTGSGVSQYFLYIGNSVGGNDIYGASQGVATSGIINGLPTDGRTLYVRLWSFISSGWQYRDYTYTCTAVFAASLTEVQGRWFRLTNSYLGPQSSLDTYSNGYNDPFMGTTGNYSGQYWYITSMGGDWYRLTNSFLGVGRSLDTYSGTINTPFMGTTGDFSGQYWHLTAYGDHCFRLTNWFLGEGRSLDTYADTHTPFMGITGNYSGQCWRLTVL